MSKKNLFANGAGAVLILLAILSTAAGCVSPTSNAGTQFKEVVAVTSPAPAGAGPDLVITGVSLQGCQIYYTIKNIGNADAGPTTTNLYVNGVMPPSGATSYVDGVKAGQEIQLTFSNYQWPWCNGGSITTGSIEGLVPSGSGSLSYVDPAQNNFTARVCANAGNQIAETDTNNNCFTRILSGLVDYNLIPLAHLADWTNGTPSAPMFGAEDSQNGAYINQGDVSLEMVPNQVPQGWIQGTWGAFYTEAVSRSDMIAAIKVPASLHFKATVGLADNAQAGDGVTFRLGLKDLGDTVTFLPGKRMTVPGQFEDWDIDLSGYEGQTFRFILRVDAVGSPAREYAVWKQARLVQVNP